MKGGIDSGLGRWGASEEGIPFGCDSSFSKRVAHVAKNVFLPDVRGRCCQIFIETSNGAHLHSAFFHVFKGEREEEWKWKPSNEPDETWQSKPRGGGKKRVRRR